jgi:hypothetical protein
VKPSSAIAGSRNPPRLPASSQGLDEDLDFDDEPEYYKDSYYPDFDSLPGETSIAFNIRYAFACGGYRVTSVEEVKTHPVLVVRAVRKDTKPVACRSLLFRHVRDLMRRAGFPLNRDELTVDQTGKRILVAFMSGAPPADIEAILREPHDE